MTQITRLGSHRFELDQLSLPRLISLSLSAMGATFPCDKYNGPGVFSVMLPRVESRESRELEFR